MRDAIFDEVHPPDRLPGQLRCTLKRRPPKYSRLGHSLIHAEACPWMRPARTPPSTFLFLQIQFSNSPGIAKSPLPGEPESRRSPGLPINLGADFTVISEVLRNAPTSPLGGRHVVGRVYRSGPLLLSTPNSRKMRCGAPFPTAHKQPHPAPCKILYICTIPAGGSAVLRPHSSDVLSPKRGQAGRGTGALSKP